MFTPDILDDIVTWNKTYSVNIPLIDEQHMELIEWTNKLFRSCYTGNAKSKSVFFEVLRATVDYIDKHFSMEEKIMQRVNYPDYGSHKQVHNNFVKKVLEASAELSKDERSNPLTFVRFLKDWVLSHIAVCDAALGKYLVELKKTGALNGITLKP